MHRQQLKFCLWEFITIQVTQWKLKVLFINGQHLKRTSTGLAASSISFLFPWRCRLLFNLFLVVWPKVLPFEINQPGTFIIMNLVLLRNCSGGNDSRRSTYTPHTTFPNDIWGMRVLFLNGAWKVGRSFVVGGRKLNSFTTQNYSRHVRWVDS